MKLKNTIILLLCLMQAFTSVAQQKDKMTREEKDEKNQARLTRISNKNDYVVFHRQLLALKEYADERKKIPVLQKANKGIVKVVAVVDSLDDEMDAKNKTLLGYIRQDIGDVTTNMYEITFDRQQKKIVTVIRTPEAMEADKEELADKAEKTTTVKTKEKTTVVTHKKKSEDDDDDDADEDKPAPKSKSKKDSDDD